MKIKIIGCGFAGLSSALLLSSLPDTEIEIYEKFENVKPVGAGLLLQPSITPFLNELNILSRTLEFIEPINKIVGKNIHGKEILTTSYNNEFGMGTNRVSFFNMLYQDILKKPNIKVNLGHEVNEMEMEIFSKNSDLVIVCSGSKSILGSSFKKKISQNYPFGCLWGILPNNDFTPNLLSQFVDGSKEMFGILPSGKINNQRMLSVFWSVPLNNAPLNFKDEINKISKYRRFLPDTPDSLNNNDSLYQDIINMDFSLAQYKHIVMNEYHRGNTLLIGDTAHSMSPQLGQGANMALLDSYLLYKLINHNNSLSPNNKKDIPSILKDYSKLRKKHLHFYSQASRFLTPLFQSNNKLNGIQRDFIFSLLGKTSFVQWMNSSIIRGTRQSWLYNDKIKYHENDFFK